MKRTTQRSLLLAGAACLATPAILNAAAAGTNSVPTSSSTFSADKFYLDVDAGGSIIPDVDIQSATGGAAGKVVFDTGFRLAVGVGYNVCSSASLELETGVIWNPIHSVAGNALTDFNSSAGLYQVPLLLNAVYRPHVKCPLKPYVGLGIGGVAGVFDSSNIPLFGSPASPNLSDTDFTFAYQATVGVKYAVSQHAELGVAYKFLGTTDHDWSDNGVTLKTDGTMTHTILASFTWRF